MGTAPSEIKAETVTLSIDPLVLKKAEQQGIDLSDRPILPDRELLAFRAMCGRVAYDAGVAMWWP